MTEVELVEGLRDQIVDIPSNVYSRLLPISEAIAVNLQFAITNPALFLKSYAYVNTVEPSTLSDKEPDELIVDATSSDLIGNAYDWGLTLVNIEY